MRDFYIDRYNIVFCAKKLFDYRILVAVNYTLGSENEHR